MIFAVGIIALCAILCWLAPLPILIGFSSAFFSHIVGGNSYSWVCAAGMAFVTLVFSGYICDRIGNANYLPVVTIVCACIGYFLMGDIGATTLDYGLEDRYVTSVCVESIIVLVLGAMVALNDQPPV